MAGRPAIPNVEDLAAEFSVARGTIREALGVLEAEGLLVPLPGQGHVRARRSVREVPTGSRRIGNR